MTFAIQVGVSGRVVQKDAGEPSGPHDLLEEGPAILNGNTSFVTESENAPMTFFRRAIPVLKMASYRQQHDVQANAPLGRHLLESGEHQAGVVKLFIQIRSAQVTAEVQVKETEMSGGLRKEGPGA